MIGRRRRSSPAAPHAPSRGGGLRLVVVCPHFEPDTAPTGVVISRIVHELAARGNEVHVVTSLPWYRAHAIEPGWTGARARRERTTWGSITRVDPFPGGDKRNLLRRAIGFGGFSVLVALAGLRAGGVMRRADGVLAMSPPLTLGLAGWAVRVVRRGPLVFNIQDVWPDAAVDTGAIRNRWIIGTARWLERLSYHRASAVTVLSDDLRENVVAKVRTSHHERIRVIPNFVDTSAIAPLPRMTQLRHELDIGDEPVVMYAGNVGFSQSLHLMLDAARLIPSATFVINGDGAARASLQQDAVGIPNIRFSPYQPADRLAEVLATGDLHVVSLKAGLGRVSVPSKTYSIMAAGRPIVAAIDPGTEMPRIVTASGAGVAIAPDDSQAFSDAVLKLLASPSDLHASGECARRWVMQAASPAAVAAAYEDLFRELARRR